MGPKYRAQPCNGGYMTTEFTRVCDIWKTFWQALEEELLALGGSIEMLERLAKRDFRPAIRELAKTLVTVRKLVDIFAFFGKINFVNS